MCHTYPAPTVMEGTNTHVPYLPSPDSNGGDIVFPIAAQPLGNATLVRAARARVIANLPPHAKHRSRAIFKL